MAILRSSILCTLQRRHELVVALYRGVQFGAIDVYAGILIIAYLVGCKRTADHVAGEPLTSFGIGGLAADAVVQRSSAPVLRQGSSELFQRLVG